MTLGLYTSVISSDNNILFIPNDFEVLIIVPKFPGFSIWSGIRIGPDIVFGNLFLFTSKTEIIPSGLSR